MKRLFAVILVGLLTAPSSVRAQGGAGKADQTFNDAAESVMRQLHAATAELAEFEDEVKNKQVPLSRKLSELESQLSEDRSEYQQTSRLLDSRALDLNNLRQEIKARREESNYLSNLLGEYLRNFESRLHIAEMQRYRDQLEEAKLAGENRGMPQLEVFQTQAKLLDASLQRLEEALGGSRFDGTAVDDSGLVQKGSFVLVGPAALFRSEDGQVVGTVEQRLGSLEPTVIAYKNPEQAKQAAGLVEGVENASLPLDPTLGNAHVIESTEETIQEHVKKGGPVVIPIFVLASAALLVALFKWLTLLFVRKPSRKRLRVLLDAVARHDRPAAEQAAVRVGGPAGKMLSEGVKHLDEPRELIEEVMYEKLLTTRLKMQRLLPFIAVAAASAPLLGLLGTVTGIISTFKLITVFGTGDVKTLSGGISEALITTELGLVVAIPSLLLHAFLSRKAKGVTDEMEKAAIALVNQIGKTPFHTSNNGDGAKTTSDTDAARDGSARLTGGDGDLDVVTVPEVMKTALAHMADRLKSHDQEAISAALTQLNRSAAEFMKAVYASTQGDQPAPQPAVVEAGAEPPNNGDNEPSGESREPAS